MLRFAPCAAPCARVHAERSPGSAAACCCSRRRVPGLLPLNLLCSHPAAGCRPVGRCAGVLGLSVPSMRRRRLNSRPAARRRRARVALGSVLLAWVPFTPRTPALSTRFSGAYPQCQAAAGSPAVVCCSGLSRSRQAPENLSIRVASRAVCTCEARLGRRCRCVLSSRRATPSASIRRNVQKKKFLCLYQLGWVQAAATLQEGMATASPLEERRPLFGILRSTMVHQYTKRGLHYSMALHWHLHLLSLIWRCCAPRVDPELPPQTDQSHKHEEKLARCS